MLKLIKWYDKKLQKCISFGHKMHRSLVKRYVTSLDMKETAVIRTHGEIVEKANEAVMRSSRIKAEVLTSVDNDRKALESYLTKGEA